MTKKYYLIIFSLFFALATTCCSGNSVATTGNEQIYVIIKDTDPLTQEIPDNRFKMIEYYHNRYQKDFVTDKITNNHGNGNDSLYGTRNMRPVLHGVWYRGGANNAFHKRRKRDNRNPLPNDGLKNLCREGFSSAFYLYSTRYSRAKKSISVDSTKPPMPYLNNTVPSREKLRELVQAAYRVMTSDSLGPIYAHCWNGWHQTGYVASTMLMQFCDYSPRQALQYWNECTDGVNKGYDHIKNAILSFEKFEGFEISHKLQEAMCPCMKYKGSELPPIEYPDNFLTGIADGKIEFEPNSVNFTKESAAVLDKYAEFLTENDFINIEIQGHTDNSGDLTENNIISGQRAENVYNYLIKKGIDKERLSYKGYGPSKPKYTNNTKDGRAKNRRIEFNIKSIEFKINLNEDTFEINEFNKKQLDALAGIVEESGMQIEIEYHNYDDNRSKEEEAKAALWAKSIYNYLLDKDIPGTKLIYDDK